ncbi:hypothetical protein [Methanogenium sp. MK-MG]|uniref:hypothetical protein n=1 Tax=Methanogenium sp. MK-MG TaxID=2599926 RepID=UPI0013ED014E|nr:hypothetical protein [Methanogenium sp. MK-MG]KAF1078471.1 hypothetical protein MKMG_00622 [Methanogenium sp. MK-MG]
MDTITNNSMILEEKISFDEEFTALEFIDWLTEFGCKAKLHKTFEYFTEDVISGSIDDIDSWCSEMSTDDPELSLEYLDIKQKNLNVKYAMQIILEGRSVGDLIYTRKDWKLSDVKLMSAITKSPVVDILDFSSERFNNEIFNKLPLSYIHLLIKDSDCISESEDGFTLTRDITPGEIINEMTIDSLNLSDQVEYPGLCNIFNYIPDISYEVIFSLPSHIHLEPLHLARKLGELGIHQKDIRELINPFSLKRQIILKILEIIEDNKVISTEELTNKLRDVQLGGADEWGHSILLIDIIVTQQFVFELRKAGYITGNDQKLRIPSKPGKRRRN